MNARYLNRFTLILAVAAGLCACGGSAAVKPESAAPQETSLSDAYAAEALATYQLQRDGARSIALLAAARKHAPKRVDLVLLQMSICRLAEDCQPEPYEAQLRKMDAGNGIVWMRALNDAQQHRDSAVEMHILDAIGDSKRFDLYWNRLVTSITAVRVRNGARAEAALNETVAWLGSTIVPSFQPLTVSCSRIRTGESQWAKRCRRAGQVLMNSDTYIAESIGLHLVRQVTADPNERLKLEDRSRTARYLWRGSGEIINSQVERDRFALELLDLMRNLQHEQDVHLAIMWWAGRPLTPPPGWRDE